MSINKPQIHFIAIGGSAMHNLAIALKLNDYIITGSDDEIFEPSKSRLAKHGLLPNQTGWNTANIHPELDAVILGMHAKADNPELIKARELGLTIYSYPEYLYEQSKNKIRVVIGGSHGKTTITSMILHVLKHLNIETNYMVGAQLEGFEVMVKLSDSAPFMILEGDEYLSSPLDPRPKFHLYKPNIALISGIAWDHINVFPTYEVYLEQFKEFIKLIEKQGKLIYCAEDPEVKGISEAMLNPHIENIPYFTPESKVSEDKTIMLHNGNPYPLQIFGRHNLSNLSGAREVCYQLGVSPEEFNQAIGSFSGAGNRLEVLRQEENFVSFKDFAHAPSKVKASVEAVRQQYPEKTICAFLELHTYSSLNKKFLDQYKHSMNAADDAFIYFNPHALQIKRLEDISMTDVQQAFKHENLKVFNDSELLKSQISQLSKSNTVFLFMSSGNFGDLDIKNL